MVNKSESSKKSAFNTNVWLDFEGITVGSKICKDKANIAELKVKGETGKIVGVCLRLYNPQTKQWSLNYANMKKGNLETNWIADDTRLK